MKILLTVLVIKLSFLRQIGSSLRLVNKKFNCSNLKPNDILFLKE